MTCAAFKAVWLRANPRNGGFDSHPLPPFGRVYVASLVAVTCDRGDARDGTGGVELDREFLSRAHRGQVDVEGPARLHSGRKGIKRPVVRSLLAAMPAGRLFALRGVLVHLNEDASS